jgi:hypothetical protein
MALAVQGRADQGIGVPASLSAGLADFGASPAMSMIVRRASIGAEMAGLRAGPEQRRQRGRLVGCPSSQYPSRRKADVRAIEVEADASAQGLYRVLAKAGVGAGRASRRAFIGSLRRLEETTVGRIPRMIGQHGAQGSKNFRVRSLHCLLLIEGAPYRRLAGPDSPTGAGFIIGSRGTFQLRAEPDYGSLPSLPNVVARDSRQMA